MKSLLRGSRSWTAGFLVVGLLAFAVPARAEAADSSAEAIRQLEEALAQTTGHKDTQRAQQLTKLGRLLQRQGRYTAARVYLKECRELCEELPGPRQLWLGPAKNNYGLLLMDLGEYPEAEELFRDYLAIVTTASKRPDFDPDMAWADNNLGELCRRMGQHHEAEKFIKASLAIYANVTRQGEKFEGKTLEGEVLALNNLGILYQQLGRWDEAEDALNRALRAWKNWHGTKDSKDPFLGDVAGNLAWLYFDRGREGDLQRAREQFEKALDILQDTLPAQHPRLARAEASLGWVYHTLGLLDRAEPLYRSSLESRSHALPADHPDVVLSRYNLALLLASRGKWQEAATEMDRARQDLGHYLTRTLPFLPEPEQLAFLKTQREQLDASLSLGFARRQGSREEDRRLVEMSAEWLLNGKGMARQAMAERTRLARDRNIPELREWLEVRDRMAWLTFQNIDRDELQQLQRKEANLSAQLGKVAGVSGQPWITLAEVRKQLPQNAVLVEVAKFAAWDFQARARQDPKQAQRYGAWVIPAQGEGKVRLIDLGPAGPLDQAARKLREGMEDAIETLAAGRILERDSEHRVQPLLDEVARRVWQPLAAELGPKERWIISPDGELSLLSWAMLPVDGKKRYAVLDHTISYVVSGRDLLAHPARGQPAAPLVMANPDFELTPDGVQEETARLLGSNSTKLALRGGTPALAGLQFEALPGTEKEAEVVVPRLAKLAGEPVTLRRGPQALERVFKEAHGPRFVMLSTHGFSLDDPPDQPAVNPLLRCGLALAGANQRARIKANQEDGILTGLEIVGTDLRGTELVVLSACGTGLGKAHEGEGVAGLLQAFQLAGARTVLSTLWSIDDEETPQIMSSYFDNLVAGKGKAEALRQAQLAWIKAHQEDVGAAHPCYWGAFTSTGQAD